MNKIIRISLSSVILLVLSACNFPGAPNPAVGETPVVKLTVQTQDGRTTFSTLGEIINYNYIVTNTGTSPLAGPVIVADLPRVATCPEVGTVGNADNYLNLNETITCTAAYSVTQADINAGSVINVATVNVGGVNSNQSGVTLLLNTATAQPSPVLTLTKTASLATYGQVGQTITYMYVITNTGTAPLGPDQFRITDNKFGAPFNCGPAATTVAPSQSLNCSASYTVTQADITTANLTNIATASGAGQTSAPATTTVTNFTITQTASAIQTPTVSPGLTPGSTVQHHVAVGEWLIQIGRCYGATLSELLAANQQIADPNIILEAMIVTVPRIGSAGPIYGPNSCVVFHTVQSGDTWTSIQQTYNACLSVLQRVNPAGLIVGSSVKVPRNSASLYCPDSTTSPGSPGVTPRPPTPTAQRITIEPGQTTASRIGLINPNETIQFVLNATLGQVLTIKLTAPANEVAVGVNGPTGLALKPLDPTPTWNTTITTGGDHFINVKSVLGSSTKSYTLDITLTPAAAPATATSAPTPTNTPLTPVP